MTISAIDPLRDSRWSTFVLQHPAATVFHTPEWLCALKKTYGFTPVAVVSTASDGTIDNGIPFCEISSWATGRRLVSLPFSDHCEPLIRDDAALECILAFARDYSQANAYKYLELRPTAATALRTQFGCSQGEQYWHHVLDLGLSEEAILRSFHKDCVTRKIRRADREGLKYVEGRSDEILREFYRLLILTRRRHELPPQPVDWFKNLLESLGEKATIRLALKDGRAVASILTLTFGSTMVYKYGCSDERAHQLGGIPWLYWKGIQEAKRLGCARFDMGRSDLDNEGLITFKDRWGAERRQLTYWRSPASKTSTSFASRLMRTAGRHVLRRIPTPLLPLSAKFLYRHAG